MARLPTSLMIAIWLVGAMWIVGLASSYLGFSSDVVWFVLFLGTGIALAEWRAADEAGGDEKIIAGPTSKLTQRYAHVKNYADLPEITWRQIEHFFSHYKDLEAGKWVKFAGWGDAEEAKRLIVEAIARAKNQSTS